MQVIASGKAGFPCLAYDVSSGNLLSFFDGYGREVPVNALQSKSMINHDGIAVNAEKPGIGYDPAVGRRNGGLLRYREIESEMVWRSISRP